jgi:hypothetical protein
MIEGIRNLIHHEVQRFLDRRMRRSPCIVDGYRGDLHAVKVKLQPSGTLTGWIQIETDQIGSLIAPNIGDPGWLDFHEDDRRAAVFVGSNHNDSFPPPQQISAGERLVKTSFGSSLYFKNDGSIKAIDKNGASILLSAGAITATDKSGSTATLDGSGGITLTPSGGTATINGNLAVTGAFSVANTHGVSAPCVITGNINLTGALAASGDVTGNGHSLSGHVHSDPQGGTTGPAIG